MFIQRQRLKSIEDAVVQVRIVKQILFCRFGLQMQFFEPWDAWYTQRANGIKYPNHLNINIKPGKTAFLKSFIVSRV